MRDERTEVLSSQSRKMPVLKTCCCCMRVKKGCYLCAIYSLILYTFLFIFGLSDAQTIVNCPSKLILRLIMVVLAVPGVASSFVLLFGLWKDNRYLLLPWTVAVSMITVADVMISLYLIRDKIQDPILAALFAADVIFWAANVYGLLCVLSQYQEYEIGQVKQNIAQQRGQEVGQEVKLLEKNPLDLP